MIIHRHQRKTHGRTRGTSIAGGESRAPFSAARKDVQNRPGLRLRAGFSSVKTPPRGGFIVSSLNLGRAYGLGSLSRRFTSSRLQFHRIGYQPGSDFPDPLERHVRHSKSVGFNTDELMRGLDSGLRSTDRENALIEAAKEMDPAVSLNTQMKADSEK